MAQMQLNAIEFSDFNDSANDIIYFVKIYCHVLFVIKERKRKLKKKRKANNMQTILVSLQNICLVQGYILLLVCCL